MSKRKDNHETDFVYYANTPRSNDYQNVVIANSPRMEAYDYVEGRSVAHSVRQSTPHAYERTLSAADRREERGGAERYTALSTGSQSAPEAGDGAPHYKLHRAGCAILSVACCILCIICCVGAIYIFMNLQVCTLDSLNQLQSDLTQTINQTDVANGKRNKTLQCPMFTEVSHVELRGLLKQYDALERTSCRLQAGELPQALNLRPQLQLAKEYKQRVQDCMKKPHCPASSQERVLMLVVGGEGRFANSLHIKVGNPEKIKDTSQAMPATSDRTLVTYNTRFTLNATYPSASCVINNVLYAAAVGPASDELWSWSPERDEWTRLNDLPEGRIDHCVVCGDDKIYLLGGMDTALKHTDFVLSYDVATNQWTGRIRLIHAVRGSACVLCGEYIYIFGGTDSSYDSVAHVQVYHTSRNSTWISSSKMPSPQMYMKAVLRNKKALLVGEDACYIYDLMFNRWEERHRFKTNVTPFGLVLNKDRLYLVGVRSAYKTDRYGVKSIMIDEVLGDKEGSEWKDYDVLPYMYSYRKPISMIFSSAPIHRCKKA